MSRYDKEIFNRQSRQVVRISQIDNLSNLMKDYIILLSKYNHDDGNYYKFTLSGLNVSKNRESKCCRTIYAFINTINFESLKTFEKSLMDIGLIGYIRCQCIIYGFHRYLEDNVYLPLC